MTNSINIQININIDPSIVGKNDWDDLIYGLTKIKESHLNINIKDIKNKCYNQHPTLDINCQMPIGHAGHHYNPGNTWS